MAQFGACSDLGPDGVGQTFQHVQAYGPRPAYAEAKCRIEEVRHIVFCRGRGETRRRRCRQVDGGVAGPEDSVQQQDQMCGRGLQQCRQENRECPEAHAVFAQHGAVRLGEGCDVIGGLVATDGAQRFHQAEGHAAG